MRHHATILALTLALGGLAAAAPSPRGAPGGTVHPDYYVLANFSFTTSQLTASFTDASTSSGTVIAQHAWNFGDGATSTAVNPTHTYAAAGTYSVTETVVDNAGFTGSTTKSVTLASGGDSPQTLVNPGFESTGGWTASSGVICSPGASGCGGEAAHAGAGFAWMGGYGSTHSDTLSQSAVVYVGSTLHQLKFFLHVDTAETGTKAYDKLAVAVYDARTGALLSNLATYSNLNHASGFQAHVFDASAWQGKRVTVKFTATEDSSLQTSFVLDDVTLTSY